MPSLNLEIRALPFYKQAFQIARTLQRFTTYFACVAYRTSSKVHECLMLYLNNWAASLRRITNYLR